MRIKSDIHGEPNVLKLFYSTTTYCVDVLFSVLVSGPNDSNHFSK